MFGKRLTAAALILIVTAAFLCLPIQSHTAATQVPHSNENAETGVSDDLLWPIPGYRHIASFYGYRNIAVYGYTRLHTGVDINAAIGAPVYATQSGTVLVSCTDGGYGEYIIIHHGDNFTSVYGHLSKRSVERLDVVQQGDLIGYAGNTGLSSGPHLHFELRINGSSVNPFLYSYS